MLLFFLGFVLMKFHGFELIFKDWHVILSNYVGFRLYWTPNGCARNLLVNLIERLRTDKALIALLAEQLLKNATVEAEALLPYQQILNFGKGSAYRAEQEHAGLRSLKKRGREEDSRHFSSEAQIDEAVTALFAWLTKPHSALRGLLLVLAASGLPFAAMAGERTLCSWIQGGNATVEIAKEAANAVRTASTSGTESSASSAALATAREAEVSALFAPKPKRT